MITVSGLLQIKGNAVWTVSSDATILDALRCLKEKDVGALVVVDADQMVGIISERDFVRSIAETGNCLIDAPVRNLMTQDVITVAPDQTIEACMQLMTAHKVRHLPVMHEDHLVGLISIGDVVKEIINSKESLIDNLENYITGRGYGH